MAHSSSSSSGENKGAVGAVGRPLQKLISTPELEEDILFMKELKKIEKRVAGLTVQEGESEFQRLETEADRIYHIARRLEFCDTREKYCYKRNIEIYNSAWKLYKKAIAICPKKWFVHSKIKAIECKLHGDSYYQEALQYDPKSEDSCRQALNMLCRAQDMYFKAAHEDGIMFISYTEAGKLAEKITADLDKLLEAAPVVQQEVRQEPPTRNGFHQGGEAVELGTTDMTSMLWDYN